MWLRWLAVFPGASLAGILSRYPLHWVLYSTLSPFLKPYPPLPERLLASFVDSGVFVWVGAAIAPAYKSRAAAVLFAVQIVLIAIVAVKWFEAAGLYRWRAYGAELGMGAAGAAVGFYIVRRKVSPWASPKLRLGEPVPNEVSAPIS
jgi:hypothetical protein